MSWKSFRSGNTVKTEYLNRIPNPEYLTGANPKSRIPNWSECGEMFDDNRIALILENVSKCQLEPKFTLAT